METLGTVILSTIASSGVIGFIIKILLTEKISKSISHDYNQKLEEFKTKLQIEAHKRNIEYSRIHEKRLDIIAELAGKIYTFHQTLGNYVSMFENSDGPSKKERREKLGETLGEFLRFYRPKRLFLPKKTTEKIDAFIKKSNDVSFEFMSNVEQSHELAEDAIKSIDVWVKSDEFASKEVPEIIKIIENDFRELLGMTENE